MKQKPLTYIKSFGLRLFITEFIILLLSKLNILKSIQKKLKESKNKQINNILIKRYGYIIKKYQGKSYNKGNYSNKIWIFWYQGIESAPDIVKLSIESIKNNNPDKEIIIITKDNIDNYYNMPDYIKNKIDNGEITLTHLSDILRMNLLKTYGGFWIDATIYFTNKVKLDDKFNTIKFHNSDSTSISNGNWCGFFIGGTNQLFYNFMVDFFNEYWKKEHVIIDYFLIDYTINIAYNNIDDIKKHFDNVTYNNENIHKLQSLLNKKFNKKEYNELLKTNNIHKLSYKDIINQNDKENYYNKIINKID